MAEPLQDDRDQRQDDEAADRKKDVWLEEGGAVGRAAARQDRAEARSNAGENERSGMIPTKVPMMKVDVRTPRNAGARLTSQKGNSGTRRSTSM